ncbi:hypothetical protein VP1G_07121 [Cytospora mali]|uniref:Uncharacterized protein n=1 Tax=Cytospora mali TaxID=578113 RepID=A0A194V7A9_CYTMA|nr:hypothetical protein VP1G_07121 [Valsa mali var. pyri (nom. inval.)]
MSVQYQDSEDPLTSVPLELPYAGVGEGLATRNASPTDWERHNVVERTKGTIHVYCELMDVQHGNLGNDPKGDDLASLMVFRFRFDPQKKSRRVLSATASVEFFPAAGHGNPPAVEAIAPDDRWSLMPTKDHEEDTAGSELSLGTSQVVEASGKVNWSKTRSREVSGATIVSGARNLATGKDNGPYAIASWVFIENEKRQSGVPDSVRVALLVRRENDEPFNAEVKLSVNADLASNVGQFLKKNPVDDPILFNPKAAVKNAKGRTTGVLNLDKVDLYSLCDARMSAKAFWAVNATE